MKRELDLPPTIRTIVLLAGIWCHILCLKAWLRRPIRAESGEQWTNERACCRESTMILRSSSLQLCKVVRAGQLNSAAGAKIRCKECCGVIVLPWI